MLSTYDLARYFQSALVVKLVNLMKVSEEFIIEELSTVTCILGMLPLWACHNRLVLHHPS